MLVAFVIVKSLVSLFAQPSTSTYGPHLPYFFSSPSHHQSWSIYSAIIIWLENSVTRYLNLDMCWACVVQLSPKIYLEKAAEQPVSCTRLVLRGGTNPEERFPAASMTGIFPNVSFRKNVLRIHVLYVFEDCWSSLLTINVGRSADGMIIISSPASPYL